MKKYIWMFFGVALLVVILLVVFLREEGGIKSPQSTVTFSDGDLAIEVIYCRPSKRGRKIFGGLVPYDSIWRTGANEPTEFHTNKDLNINGQELKAGDYSLWAQPSPASWKIYINSNIPGWGVNEDGKPARDPQSDVLVTDVASSSLDQVVEMFTIAVAKADSTYNLTFSWDKTRVDVPFKSK